jgi:transposase
MVEGSVAPLELPIKGFISGSHAAAEGGSRWMDIVGPRPTMANMAKGFLPYTLDQRLLLPPDLREWLPDGHLASFVSDVVEALDLSPILKALEKDDDRGRAGYHPTMMVKLLIYAYCVGKPSSRKIERATYEDVAFRVLSGDQHPDHDSIADFRKRHLVSLAGLFVQVLQLCRQAGLVKLGHIAIDGTKIQANASKHKAMSYGRMGDAEKKLQEEVQRLLQEAARVDAQEEAEHGKGTRGDELPRELARRETRLQKIREAKAALEEQAREQARTLAAEVEAKLAERAQKEAETGKKTTGPKPEAPSPDKAKPDAKAQRNFTDPESRIMPDGAHKGAFLQGYNAQIAVDATAQIIVACDVTQQTNDKKQLVPMATRILANVGRLADVTSADAGYFSEAAVDEATLASTQLLVPPNREKHGVVDPTVQLAHNASASERMRHAVGTPVGRALYRMRKAIVEPVFGQIKEARAFRRFLLRGVHAVKAEFAFLALTHNLLKLFRHAPRLATPRLAVA